MLGDELTGRRLVLFRIFIRFFVLFLAVRKQVQRLCVRISERLFSSGRGYLLLSFFIVTRQLGLLEALLEGVF